MYLTNEQVQEIYAKRARQLAYLAKQETIHVMDIFDLDRLGCYSVACDFWKKCTAHAQECLLNHQHPHVVSAAKLSLISSQLTPAANASFDENGQTDTDAAQLTADAVTQLGEAK